MTTPVEQTMTMPVDQTVALPLSFAQERLWFLDRLQPGSPLYNIPAVLRLMGTVDEPALERALGEIVARHEALRTVFREEDGSPVQVIAPSMDFALPLEDLAHLDEAERIAEARRRATEEAERPFDLAEGPLFRVSLLRLAPEDRYLLLTIHHIVGDGWSTGVFFRELSALYDAYSAGRESPLPELEVQYGDFALWQREQLQGETLDRELAWWKERLSGAPELLELPTDRPRPAVQTYRGAHEHIDLPAGLPARLTALARGERATLFMTLLGAFQVLLAKYAGSDDVVVGSPIAGRTQSELEALIGFFVNTLVLRTDLSGDPTFRETVRRVRAVTLGAYEHQEVPFERLVGEIRPERSLSHAPLFQVMFSLQNTDPAMDELPGVTMQGVEAELHTAKFDLSMALTLSTQGLEASLAYSTDLFERDTALRMLAQYRRVLERVAADPDVRLSELDLLAEGERGLVLEEWNRTEAEYPSGLCVHQLFEAQAARAPDAVALVSGGQSLTYRELNRRANRIAHHLRGLGVGPESRVGICLPRTPGMVAALLGVLKAGAAYLPLDPEYPRERLGWMLEDAGARLVLTESALADRLPAGAEAVCLDGIAEALRELPADDPRSGALPENLSHVIFTSGSTGRPKGVMIRHSSVVVLLHWLRDAVTDEERRAVLFATSISFDVSVAELFGTLCWGGTLHLAENALSLAEMRDAGIVYASMVPTAAAELLRMGAIPPSVRTLNLAGEALPAALARGLYEHGVEKVGDVYGPTEDTTYSTYSLVPRGAERVTVGRGIANTRAYVLDGGLNPAPVGIPGELYLAGDGTARGYAGRPDLTAERFLPDPFSARPGTRMYRVMDRMRWTAAGELEYLGRTDTQVKVRGFRVELGEIESTLLRHPGVRSAVAVAREDAPGERRLVAYVVPGDAAPDAAGLRAHLRERLPEYMVPGAFVLLETLPLTPSGKLDRRALPAPEHASDEERHVAPRTPAEELLAGIWAEILRLDRVGVTDSFFELGGHSLMAIRVVSRIRESLGVELPLRVLFEAPTVAELSARVEALRRAELPVLPPVIPTGRTGPLPLSFAQERLWFLDRLEPGSAFYNVPAALRLGGALDRPALERALGEIVRRHEALRTVFAEAEGGPVQAVAPFDGFALPVEDVSMLGGAEREAEAQRRATESATRPFDLAAGPLFRAELLRLAEDDHVLLLCMHHVVGDAWSLDVLFRELSVLYGAYLEGRPSPLPELPVQPADHAVWQREQLRGDALERQLAWWKERLAGAPALLELPTDRPRPPVQTYRGATERIELPADLLARLTALGRGEGATLFMTLLAAWQVLLAKYAGSDDVVVGSPIAGRTRREVEDLIGFFLNTLVLRTDLSGAPTFREALRRVREATLGAYEHQEVPFERLVEELQPERSLSHAPLFQAMLVLQQPGSGGGGLPGLEVSRLGTASGTSKFDLTLALAAYPGAGIAGSLEYSTDLFERATVLRMLAHFERVLEQVAADPDVRIAELDLAGVEERRRVLEEWNRTDAEYPAGLCIHHLFEAQAGRTPDAPAVTFGGESLTYRELDERAGRLAHRLAGLGVGPDARVGLCLERGPGAMAALLGILKAGGACVPLDPSYPAERLAYMLADSGARVLLTDGVAGDKLAAFEGQVVALDGTPLPPAPSPARGEGENDGVEAGTGAPDGALTPRPPLPILGEGEHCNDPSEGGDAETQATLPQNWGRVASLSEPGGGEEDASSMSPGHDDAADGNALSHSRTFALLHSPSPDNLAYVVYTSGSTGTPKGVAMPHRPLVNLLAWQQRDWRAPAATTTLQFAPVSFDVSFQEMFSCWAAGGRLVLIEDELRYDPARLLATLESEGVERLFMPAVALQHLAEAAEARGAAPSRLREVVTAGEQLRVTEPLRRWMGALGAPLHNHYGPSETHVATAFALEGDPAGWPLLPAIGAPVANARCYVLDGALRPAPVGVPGELYLGGVCVARGYLGRPEWTAERFLPDPFGGAGARAYRTGDRARWLPTGVLEFLGRADEQVKLRGFRIEPGEVEAALEALPGVREAVVVLREDVPGERRLVAYVVAEEGMAVDAAGLRSQLAGRLPEYMVPGAFVALDSLPLTPSGKVARRALPAPEPAAAEEDWAPPRLPMEETVAAIWADVLRLERVGVNRNFFDLGGHSLLLARVQARLREALGRDVPIVDLFRFPTVASLAGHLGGADGSGAAAAAPAPAPRRRRAGASQPGHPDGAVAIIGMAGRFPGAPDVERFWSNLRGGVHSVTFFGREELEAAGMDPALLGDPAFVGAAGVLEGMDRFDAAFFGFNPREAEILDPQHRIFLETAWEALENAGYGPGSTRESVGVYAGSSASDYLTRNVLTRPDIVQAVGSLQVDIGNGKDFLASRTAYKLDLRGPALNVQTACSTGLVAVHVACRALAAGECDLAVAGGVGARLRGGYRYAPGGIMSPDGHCRAFDARSGGTVTGSGVGLVVLKRLADALADGDTIHAVVRGSAINNDGEQKVGYTAPSVQGQAEVIAEALALAGVDPATVGYVEAHGTGTELGDPVEVAALTQAFGAAPRRQSCALGAVKSNVGHLDSAAGVTGLIKTVLALEHGEIPPSLHFSEPNPRIDFAASPFFVNTELRPWPANGGPRRAGVSSFGIGGTNAHVVLEEAPPRRPSEPARDWQLLTLSARTPAALEAATDRLAAHLRAHPEQELADVAWTLQAGRRAFEHRRVVVARGHEEAARALETRARDRVFSDAAPETSRPVVFLFPGLGSHYAGMGRGLYETEPVFRETVDRCAEILRPRLGLDLREVLYPPEEAAPEGGEFGVDLRAMLGRAAAESQDDLQERLNRTHLAQPALFVTEYALQRLWAEWGVRPAAMLGHSLGEWVAATVAGVWSLEDALMLVAERARLIEALPEGGMMGIGVPEEEARPLLRGNLYVGALHGPSITVISGPGEELDALRDEVAARGIVWRRLPMKHAFHTPHMEPVAEALMALLRRVKLHPPQIPFASNVTGTWIRASEATDPAYWARHLCEPVRFSEGVETLARDGFRVLLESGPGLALRMLAAQLPVWDQGDPPSFVASLRHAYERHPDPAHVLAAAGRLWAAGAAVDWRGMHAHERLGRVPLPTYPFERSRFWVEPGDMALPAPRGGDPLERKLDPADWLYLPAWTRTPLAAQAPAEPAEWLLLADEAGLGARLAARLERLGHTVVLAEAGEGFGRAGERGYTLRAGSAEDLAALRDALHADRVRPRRVVLLWGIDPESASDADAFGRAQARGYATVAALAQTFARDASDGPFRLVVVIEAVQDVFGGESVHPERAPVLGTCLALPREHADVVCRMVDVRPGAGGEHLIDQLAAEVTADSADVAVALRGPWRWTPGYEAVRPREGMPGLREGGAYLFTGGLGGSAGVLAEHLAALGARIAVVVDADFPERGDWDAAVASGGGAAATVGAIRAAEAGGGRVLVLRADPEDVEAMQGAVEAARAEFGALHGVVHTPVAGGTGFALLAEVPPSGVAAELARVARGLAALDAATAGLALDFRILQGSIASAFGGAGQAPATAAYALVDAWAQRRAAEGGARWTAVDWDHWRLDEADDTLAEWAIRREDGARAFEVVATLAEEPRVLVSIHDLGARLERFHAPLAAPARPAEAAAPREGLHARPALVSEFTAPSTEAEALLAGIWGRLLGIREIGVRDSFFDLGGHSLLGIQLLSRVRDAFQVELPLRAVFEAPTIAELAALIEEAVRQDLESAGETRAPSNWRVVGAEEDAAPRQRGRQRTQPITRRAEGGNPPLSYGQEQLWFLDRLQPGGTAYNLYVGLHLPGGVDEAALGRALGEIVRRHEALRTTFRETDGVPVQVIAPFAGFALPVEDLAGLDDEERAAEVRRRAAREAAHPFDLAEGPLFRATLLRLGAEEHVLLMCTHHIVSDGWSHQVLMSEFRALYQAYSEGRESPLPELEVQYADYAAWQRSQPLGPHSPGVAYWKRRLAGMPELLALPTDHPRPPVPTFRGARVPVEVPLAVLDRLRELGRREAATLHMVVLGAFQALLARWAGQDDVAVGSPVAGRTRREMEPLIGLFVNTLVLRTDLSGDPSFRELLGRVRETALGAYQHQDVPFEKVVAELSPQRSLSHSALFQLMLQLDEAGEAAAPAAGPTSPGVRVEPATAQFDMTLALTASPRGLAGTLEYTTDLFEEGTARRMAAHLARLFEQVAADADVRLSGVELLDEAERSRVVEEWNRTDARYPADACIHELFAAQVERTPDAVAVVFGDDEVTYRELDARADRLARRLAELGAGPEARVGICLERSAVMVAAMLAVLKSGAAYLPLDPAYPADRLAYMLVDSGVRVLVTQASLRGLLPAEGVRTVLVDADAAEVAAEPERAPRTAVAPGNAAYVIYTSGSTGRPKGVVVTHANAVSFFAGMDRVVGGTTPGTWLAVTRIGFDIHVLELLWTLARGFRVVVHPDVEQAGEDGTVARAIRRHGVTHLQCTPSLAAIVMAESGVEALSGLRRVLLGGEALPAGLAARIHAAVPGGLVNMYGPTETTVWSATHAVAGAEGAVPIGRPIANTRVYVLDDALRPQPVGVPGELYVAGAGVARGYLDRPGLTAERFLPNPFPSQLGSRMYRTGDRARWRADGTLEYLGRLDAQVKVRGFRIEPGEVEAALAAHPRVREAAVVAREDAPGDRRLVAYVVAGQGTAPDAAELRAHLAGRLPEYMVPGAFVALASLPLTPGGKLDRRALPAPEHAAAEEFVAPRTPAEETLAGIWREVLGVERVGVRDRFFELGGHSLLATRVVSRIRGVFGVALTVRAMFEHPTIEGLAGLLAKPGFMEAAGVADEPAITAIPRRGRSFARKGRAGE